MIRFKIENGWKMHRAGDDNWSSAIVPGSVYSDLLRNGLMDDPFFKDNEDKALKLMDYDYEYSCSFDKDESWDTEQCVRLHFDGLDTIADIILNGIHIGHTENMHRKYEFDIKNILKDENELRIYFHSPNKWAAAAFEKDPIRGSEDAMSGFVHMRKAHCMFGWDWGAHLPDAGIFRPVYVIAFSGGRIMDAAIIQEHNYAAINSDPDIDKKTDITTDSDIATNSDIAMNSATATGANETTARDKTGDWHDDRVRLTITPEISYVPEDNSRLFIQVSLTAPDGEICTKEIDSDVLYKLRMDRKLSAESISDQIIAADNLCLQKGKVLEGNHTDAANKEANKEANTEANSNESLEAESDIKIDACFEINERQQNSGSVVFDIPEPELWWPNGYGEHPLYTVEILLRKAGSRETVDTSTCRIGLRTCTMSTQKDEWGSEFACMVNGVRIFAMGADYIPEDHLITRVTPETTRALLEKVIFANMNSIRVWGGGYYPDDWFYDDCDELGILVWQDFMFACADYDLTPEFEANIKAEFRDNLIRLHNHCSLAVLCGNNEMETFMLSGEWRDRPQDVRDYLIMFEKILPEMCAKYAPQTFYWPASPSSGGSFDEPNSPDRGDVHYWDVWHGNKPFTEYRKFFFRFASEFGFQSFPLRKTIDMITDDPKDLNIFSYVMEKHQRNGSANGKIMNYMQQTYLYPTDFDTLLYASHLLQADAIRYGVEHWRRNRGRCMGAIVWQLNDCWPVASWSSIDYSGRLKALHYSEKRFFAPVLISCQEEGFMSSGKQLNQLPYDFEKSVRFNVANESMEDIDVKVYFEVRNAKAEIISRHEEEVQVKALTAKWLDKTELPQIKEREEYVSYSCVKCGESEPCSSGTVIFTRPKYFKYADPQLTADVKDGFITVSAAGYAAGVEILNENEDLILSDNYFDMNAGSRVVKVLSGKTDNLRLRSVYDIK